MSTIYTWFSNNYEFKQRYWNNNNNDRLLVEQVKSLNPKCKMYLSLKYTIFPPSLKKQKPGTWQKHNFWLKTAQRAKNYVENFDKSAVDLIAGHLVGLEYWQNGVHVERRENQ